MIDTVWIHTDHSGDTVTLDVNDYNGQTTMWFDLKHVRVVGDRGDLSHAMVMLSDDAVDRLAEALRREIDARRDNATVRRESQ